MDKNQALEVLRSAVDLAVRKGVYCLDDVQAILTAIETLKIKEEE